ncbi:sterile alpha motif domain-containing protein 7 [Spea bombifrons]|uniref:sterile alpha motif domain-containing protein 7 n=1 Tax=Spea bombifrons TaxID=233779 RepID=UPI00234A9826|nr:sterile alpha motif domain-containing protein 7 [Spea bombifrons]
MDPRGHLQKMSIIGDQANLEGKHLYQLPGGMSAAEIRQRQEMMMRNSMITVNPQVVMPSQQRMPLAPSQFEPRLLERDLLPTDLIIPNDARQVHMASLPAHAGLLSNRVFTGPGYNYLQTEQLDFAARRQELLQKQNMSRMEMEMNSIYQPRDIDKAPRKGFVELESPFLYQGVANPLAFRGRQMVPEGHVHSDVFVYRNALESLQGSTILKPTSPYPPMNNLQREKVRRPGRRVTNQKTADTTIGASKTQADIKPYSSLLNAEDDKDDKKDEETDPFGKSDQGKAGVDHAVDKNSMELQGSQEKNNNSYNISRERNSNCNGSDKELSNTGAAFEHRYIFQPPVHLSAAPYSFNMAINSPMMSEAHNLFLNRDVSAIQDIQKWTSQDVYNFISNLPGCSGYAQIFKDHDIDGSTLPLLTEEHLLDTMGLKLGPALKIRSQISCRLGNIFNIANLPVTGPMPSSAPVPPDQTSEVASPLQCNNSDTVPSPCSHDQDMLKASEVLTSETKDNPCDISVAQTDFQTNYLKS